MEPDAHDCDLSPVLNRFPGHRDRVQHLADQDPSFRELCRDYAECLATIRHLLHDGARSGERIEQYTELRVGLEQDLMARLGRGPDGQSGDAGRDQKRSGFPRGPAK